MSEVPVLLVEDNADDRFLAMWAIRQSALPLQVEAVGDGVEALEHLRSRAHEGASLPSLILLDLQIPRFSGLEFLQKLRDTPEIRHIPVVALTSSDNPGDQLRCRELGVVEYLLKPLSPAMILAINDRLGLA